MNARMVKSADMYQDADRYRKQALAARRSLTDEKRRQKSAGIAEELYGLLRVKTAGRMLPSSDDGPLQQAKISEWHLPVLCFYPLPDEVDLRSLYARLSDEGARLFFPVTEGERIRFFRAASMERFREGAFHVYEPIDRKEEFTANTKVRVVNSTAGEEKVLPDGSLREDAFHYISITPGAAFDRAGNRIGFGRGYYDRFFAAYPDGYRIGVLFAEQLFNSIPVSDTDIPMHRLFFA